MNARVLGLLMVTALGQSHAWAQFDSGSDGSDGPLFVPADTELVIDLALAADATWDTPSPDAEGCQRRS